MTTTLSSFISLQVNLATNMVMLHKSMRNIGATPRQYMAFVKLYNNIFFDKRKQVGC